MNYYLFDIRAYAATANHLSCTEDGAYRRLLDAYYLFEKPLPVSIEKCCALVRATKGKEIEAVKTILEEFFELQADGWHIARCDAEIAKHKITSERIRALRDGNSYRRFRALVLDRDGEKCAYCGASDVSLQLDHVIPQSRGGSDHPENLTPACKPCNTSKGAKLLGEWLP